MNYWKHHITFPHFPLMFSTLVFLALLLLKHRLPPSLCEHMINSNVDAEPSVFPNRGEFLGGNWWHNLTFLCDCFCGGFVVMVQWGTCTSTLSISIKYPSHRTISTYFKFDIISWNDACDWQAECLNDCLATVKEMGIDSDPFLSNVSSLFLFYSLSALTRFSVT